MIAVAPGTLRSSRCTASSASRCRTGVPFGRPTSPLYFSGWSVTTISGWSVTTTMFLTPSAAIWRAMIGTLSGPSCGCPPVIATASL